ncbi:MBL fold metallo-hydrolase [Nonomuraea soli]|uniref:Glyoxylase-like metal-dependent hydrolase (Beta-lactamase superfamily II) n=1 Tax=Nonomuraea soli TaxID=1032476 RepID=A0A7W0CHE9_9ACTN|nr:MBL fold metallo-hydrolase [Nonomuraea soli]MBA2891166.1 glyoxylase-like metal-dependent hydrolase (beta-lactamase superfamily II) [Nonomuraea soli]
MKIHHLNCGSMRPRGTSPTVCHVLLIEHDTGLVLVDTGIDTHIPLVSKWLLNPALDPVQTITAQLKARGINRTDVTDIVLTHLDFDHAGALPRFPHARIHLHADEHTARTHSRYQPAQWAHHPRWTTYHGAGQPWIGGLTALPLDGLDDLFLVPLPGHSPGHCGVAVHTGGPTPWLLHAGDAYFNRHPDRPTRLSEAMVATHHRTRQATRRRLDHLPADTVRVFSAHDAAELATLATPAPADSPPPPPPAR